MAASETISNVVKAVAAAYPALSEDDTVVDYISGVAYEWHSNEETLAELTDALVPLIDAYLSEGMEAEAFCAALVQQLSIEGIIAAPPAPKRNPLPPTISVVAPPLPPASEQTLITQFEASLNVSVESTEASASDKAPGSEAETAQPNSTPLEESHGENSAAASRRANARKERKQKARKGGKKSGASGVEASDPSNSGDGGGEVDVNAVMARLAEAGQQEVNDQDDYSSAWEQCKAEGRAWGGRAFGGRGVNRGGAQQRGSDAVVNQLTLSYGGKELLHEARLAVAKTRRYGLIGANGVGKTTLLRRIAAQAVPGWPLHLTTALVHQEVLVSATPVLESVLEAHGGANGSPAAALEAEQAELEAMLQDDTIDAEDKAGAADRLCEIFEALEALDPKAAEQRARSILEGLQFTATMLEQPATSLSGGWRMRLALAQALFANPDILLLDEPTNHLDLSAALWLEAYLVELNCTALIVSHDAVFLDAVCTDIIHFEGGSLKYHVGNFSTFQESRQQAFTRHQSTADAVARQEKKAKEFIEKQRSMATSKHRDDNKQKQAAERSKKLGRVGLFADNGHKFKLLAEGNTKAGGSNRAQHVFGNYTSTNGMQSAFVSNAGVAMGEAKSLLHFKFPVSPPLGGSSGDSWGLPLITMENCAFTGYYPASASAGATAAALSASSGKKLLSGLSLNVANGSRVAIVGPNGAGKSTLVKLLVGDLQVDSTTTGKLTKHPNLKIAYVAQHHIEQLASHLDSTSVAYFCATHQVSETAARQALGGFGLVGNLALQRIGTLSGGQKARLTFATMLHEAPHLMILDEPTNHLDKDSLDSLSAAIKLFKGAVIMVSHNQDFMANTSTELWTVNDGQLKVRHTGEAETFNDIFSQYRASLKKPKKKLAAAVAPRGLHAR